MQSERVMQWRFSLAIFLLSTSQAPAQSEIDNLIISVSGGTIPTFSWSPDSTVGRLVVAEGDKEVWVTETEGTNTLRSPVRYGTHPPGVAGDEEAIALVEGHTYRVSMFRWVSSEESHLIGAQEFTPSGETEKEEEAAPVSEMRTLKAGVLPSGFTLDGTLRGPAWLAATDSIANLVMVEPEEGAVPAERTVIKVLADQNEIVVGARCYDHDPSLIVSFSKERDSELEEEDHLVIVFDTFMDGRSGYVFSVNASGARFDGLIQKQGEAVNSEWDAIWEAKTTEDDSGWCAEIRIPIKSLGFGRDLNTWGFNVQRRVQRLQETSRWSGANLNLSVYQTSHAGVLTDLPPFDFGVGLSLRPTFAARAATPAPGANTDYDGDLSLDVIQKLGPNLSAALTVNTDFAETEVDVRRINVTRFPIFFPEKRTFFLEGADIFEFAGGLDEEKLVPFLTRRIGLLGSGGENLSEVPINVGAKIHGRVEDTDLGALVVNTRKMENLAVGDSKVSVPQTTMGAIRIRQNILEESSLGLIGSFGDQEARRGSWSAGMDVNYKTSSFLEDKNLVVGLWGMLNNRDDLKGDKSAYGIKVDYRSDLLSANVNSMRLGDGFDPSLGFVPRNNIHLWELSVEYKPRPSWSLVRQMFHDVTITLYNNRDNSRWEGYLVTVHPLKWQFESGDLFEAAIDRQGDRPPTAFEIAPNVDIPPGSYEWTRYTLGVRSAEKREVSAEVKWVSGDYYNGDLSTIQARLTVKPSAFFTLEFTGEQNTATVMALPDEDVDPIVLVAKKFTEELYGVRIQLNFTSDLQLSSLTQYDSQSRQLGSNSRLRWTFDPLGDFFIVYNHEMVRTAENRWKFISNQLPVKIQYTWRF